MVERTGGCLRFWEPPKTEGGKAAMRQARQQGVYIMEAFQFTFSFFWVGETLLQLKALDSLVIVNFKFPSSKFEMHRFWKSSWSM